MLRLLHTDFLSSRTGRFLPCSALIAGLCFVPAITLAADRIEGGFEIQRTGTSPHVREIARMQVDGTRAQCDRAAEMCAMIASTQGAAQGAECLAKMQPEPFTILGDPDTIGNYEVIEYHHPALQKSSVTKRSTELVPTGVCRMEVLQRESTTITHYTPGARKLFTREINPRRGVQPWRTRTQPDIGPGSLELVRQALSLQHLEASELRGGTHSVATAPSISEARIAGRQCRWITLEPPPVEGRICMLIEGIGLPINEGLSAEIIGAGVDGPVVLLREDVASFRGPVALPRARFEPDDTWDITDSSSEPNATDD